MHTRIGHWGLGWRGADRPVVDGALVDNSPRICATIAADEIAISIPGVRYGILRQCWAATRNHAKNRQY
jgi:hypothetical protein